MKAGKALCILAMMLVRCDRSDDAVSPPPPVGDEIVVAGQRILADTPVVLWSDPGGYNGYRLDRHFAESRALTSDLDEPDNRLRYSRRELPGHGDTDWTLEELAEAVDLFVIHYDAAGTSRQCFKVLHDIRGLSAHFLLDVDGTIYQTLDVTERAWHAGEANDRSIGIEIANIGAYGRRTDLDKWYTLDDDGQPRFTPPRWMSETGVRTPGYVARPARKDVVTGRINRQRLHQYDYTDAQYAALIKLTATLTRVLPRITPDVPRDEAGDVRTGVMASSALTDYHGLIGHYHLTDDKLDPGPAFDWARLIEGVRAEKPPRE